MSADITIFPEWARQEAIWVGWPSIRTYWGEHFDGARGEVAAFVRGLVAYLPVKLGVRTEADAETARKACGAGPEIHILPMGDIWFRDTGPLFVGQGTDRLALTFGFNGWGGKYQMPGDTETAQAMAGKMDCSSRAHDFILEGGAIDYNGEGTVLTTRSCLLNPNRNGWNQSDAEAALRAALPLTDIIWLDEGLVGDHTDGHVDNLARFIAPNTVVCQRPAEAGDVNADTYAAIIERLRSERLDIFEIPSPPQILSSDQGLLAASHLNFVFANGCLLVPAYDEYLSARACAQLRVALPEYEVLSLPSTHILHGGGSFHCISQNVPMLPPLTVSNHDEGVAR